jgi:hypothetical protein
MRPARTGTADQRSSNVRHAEAPICPGPCQAIVERFRLDRRTLAISAWSVTRSRSIGGTATD